MGDVVRLDRADWQSAEDDDHFRAGQLIRSFESARFSGLNTHTHTLSLSLSLSLSSSSSSVLFASLLLLQLSPSSLSLSLSLRWMVKNSPAENFLAIQCVNFPGRNRRHARRSSK